jgi:Skp family chaperone for outer membrane proteins
MRKLLIVLAAAMSVAVFTGCGESSGGADADKPITDVKAEAARMDAAALQKQADKYQAQITQKTAELDAKAKELKDIPLLEQAGDKAKKLQSEIADKTKSIDGLQERMQVYLDEAKKKAAQ